MSRIIFGSIIMMRSVAFLLATRKFPKVVRAEG